MKKLLAILFFVVIATNAFSQQPCQAYFAYNYDPTNLYLTDESYNVDSTQINVTSWYWSVQYGGASYTYNTENPVIPLNGYNGPIYVCLQIGTFLCQSVYCDTINPNTIPPDSCIASFTYQTDSIGYVYNFFDASSTNNGNINYWSWVISDQNQNILTTTNIQNPVFTFPGNGVYYACLTINSDSGCQQTSCENIYIQDSINYDTCQINVSANIGNVSVPGGSDGFIELFVTGGTPPYTFDWANLGVTTSDIYNLPSGVYVVSISTIPACPLYTYTFQISEPYDSSNIIVDTLYTNPIDTCFGYVVDSFYIDSIFISGNNIITVVWIFSGGGMNTPIYVTYTYYFNGSQIVVLTINCDGGKDLTTYEGYIYINQALAIADNDQQNVIQLYPNPVKDILNMNFGDFLSTNGMLQIYSSTGQLVFSKAIPNKTQNLKINVNNLNQGIYIIRIDDGSGKFITEKFIK